ncbi:hypothetical protein B0H19DRAFT_1254437 [Mycena capillaripes]|nr:hypothetical protein B0H19DRAFT_1254437 [Mycena capillaripes]
MPRLKAHTCPYAHVEGIPDDECTFHPTNRGPDVSFSLPPPLMTDVTAPPTGVPFPAQYTSTPATHPRPRPETSSGLSDSTEDPSATTSSPPPSPGTPVRSNHATDYAVYLTRECLRVAQAMFLTLHTIPGTRRSRRRKLQYPDNRRCVAEDWHVRHARKMKALTQRLGRFIDEFERNRQPTSARAFASRLRHHLADFQALEGGIARSWIRLAYAVTQTALRSSLAAIRTAEAELAHMQNDRERMKRQRGALKRSHREIRWRS